MLIGAKFHLLFLVGEQEVENNNYTIKDMLSGKQSQVFDYRIIADAKIKKAPNLGAFLLV